MVNGWKTKYSKDRTNTADEVRLDEFSMNKEIKSMNRCSQRDPATFVVLVDYEERNVDTGRSLGHVYQHVMYCL